MMSTILKEAFDKVSSSGRKQRVDLSKDNFFDDVYFAMQEQADHWYGGLPRITNNRDDIEAFMLDRPERYCENILYRPKDISVTLWDYCDAYLVEGISHEEFDYLKTCWTFWDECAQMKTWK